MILKDLIEYLSNEDPELVVPVGFSNPHSYRGYYEELAFEPTENITVGEMLAAAKEANGSTYDGYKGGKFTMGDYTDCFLANYSQCGEEISKILLDYMTGKYSQ